MADDEFYVEDETPEEFAAGWRAGERGATKGSRDLDELAKGIIDRAVGHLDHPTTVIIDASEWFGHRLVDQSTDSSSVTTEGPVQALA